MCANQGRCFLEKTTRTDVHDRVLISLRRIIRAVDLYSRKLVRNHNLTGPQLTILKELHRSGSCTIGVLARKIHLSNATVTGIIDRLETRSLVRRERNDRDRRKVFIHLTSEAIAILENAPSLLQDEFITAFSSIPEAEQLTIMDSLEKIAELMGAETIDAAPMLLVHPIPIYEKDLKARAIEDTLKAKLHIPGTE